MRDYIARRTLFVVEAYDNMRAARVLLFGCLAAVLLGAPPSVSKTRTQVRSGAKAPALSDAQLEKAIAERFARSKIAANHFTVRVQGGVATLEGRTDVIQHKGVATRLAKAAGARAVVNRIEVSEQARQKATANLTQGRRRAQLKRGESHPRSEPR